MLGILLSSEPKRFATPLPQCGIEWSDVYFRLTLGWKHRLDSTIEILEDFTLEKFEVGGVAYVGSAHTPLGDPLHCTATLFFGDPPTNSVCDSRPDLDFVDVLGSDLVERNPVTGVGPRFNDTDLSELARRSGIALPKLREAYGTLKQYRLFGGLLQKLVFSRTSGAHEFLTVIPDGDWRTVEFGGARRRLSLRRYVILTFHCTPMGPHRSRDRTMQAILDAGCWWSNICLLYTSDAADE